MSVREVSVFRPLVVHTVHYSLLSYWLESVSVREVSVFRPLVVHTVHYSLLSYLLESDVFTFMYVKED